MTLRLLAFFQHMPPYASAAALRGQSIVGGLVTVLGSRPFALRVLTTTPQATPTHSVELTTLPGSEVESATSLVARSWGELRMGWVASRAMANDNRGVDLLVVSTPSYIAALILCARARRLGIPYVLDVRDIYPQAYAEAGLIARGGWLYRFFAARSRALYRGARRVLTATQGLAREVASAAPSVDVQCIYNGFPAALSERRALKHKRFSVCFHGALGFFQDVETLVTVASRLRPLDVDVVVIGYGRKEALLRHAALDNLRFLGRLGFEDTIAEVERCHVGLCLRHDDEISRDAFPVKVWEYLGLGMPSIVTPACEAGAFLEEHNCGFQLPAGDVEAIVNTLSRLKSNPDECHALSTACRAAAERFTREGLGNQAACTLLADA
jgi:glycosyltransferase involved in cell wall biosynthesis